MALPNVVGLIYSLKGLNGNKKLSKRPVLNYNISPLQPSDLNKTLALPAGI